jgi:hypothetical protein
VDITIYLPDELGQWAKHNGIKLSRMLREAVEGEKKRREAVADVLLRGSETTELPVEDDDIGCYTVRLHGTRLVRDGDIVVFLGENKKLYVYDGGKRDLHSDVRPEKLNGWIVDAAYYQVLRDLGEEFVIDVGQAE